MTAYTEETFSTQNQHVLEQIRLLRNVLAETTQKLNDVRERRNQTHEELEECTRETKRRADLLVENSEVIDVLQELGELLKREHVLREQLSGRSEEDRLLWKELHDRNEHIPNKVQSLSCEVVEVKHKLDEAAANFKTAKALENKRGKKRKGRQAKPK